MKKIGKTKKTLAFLLAIVFVISVTSAIVGAANNTGGNGAANNTSKTGTSEQVTGTSASGNCKGSQPTCEKQFKAVCDKGKWKCAFVGEANNTSSTGANRTGTGGK